MPRYCSDKSGCTKPALGWAILKEGGATTVHTCDEHTTQEVKDKLAHYDPKRASIAPPAPKGKNLPKKPQPKPAAESSPAATKPTPKA